MLSKVAAAFLMSIAVLLGAWTVGCEVVTTLGTGLGTDPGVFTLSTSVVVPSLVGGALFVGNYAGVPASTSMTAVGALVAADAPEPTPDIGDPEDVPPSSELFGP